ncbi:MAG: hypothetical protein GTO03_07275, partial [Planctomycetales bacterium]|nr:hypothetical protein [Planctomycetales bacterium]
YGGEPGRAGGRGAYAVQISFVACQLVSEAGEPQTPFRWVRASQLVDYPFPAANAEIIRQLAEKGTAEKGPLKKDRHDR